jgi:anti-sigma28 factor (negative regulator of flagellin synthesis)
MKIDNANLWAPSGADQSGRNQAPGVAPDAAGDDIHLSELVRSLRSLVPDSPERQERLEQIARAYASGSYEADPEATAGKMIDDALRYR